MKGCPGNGAFTWGIFLKTVLEGGEAELELCKKCLQVRLLSRVPHVALKGVVAKEHCCLMNPSDDFSGFG